MLGFGTSRFEDSLFTVRVISIAGGVIMIIVTLLYAPFHVTAYSGLLIEVQIDMIQLLGRKLIHEWSYVVPGCAYQNT